MTTYRKQYKDRSITAQIQLNQLLRCYPYPPQFYETMTDKELHGFYQGKAGELARRSIEAMLKAGGESKTPQPEQPVQLSLF